MIATFRDAVSSFGFNGVWPFEFTPRIQTHSMSSRSAYRRRRKKSIVMPFLLMRDGTRYAEKTKGLMYAEEKARVSYARSDKMRPRDGERIKYSQGSWPKKSVHLLMRQ